jgi:hypothetical protein
MKIGMVLEPETYEKRCSFYYSLWFEAAYLFQWRLRGKHVSTEFPNNLDVIAIQILSMLETEPRKVRTLVDTLKSHATDHGGDYLQADWYAYYASIDPKNAFANERVLGGLLGTLLDYRSGPKYRFFQNLTDRPDYEPHYSDSMSEYAIFPSDRAP